MASHTQTPSQTAFQHQESNTPTDSSLNALDDALLAHIISYLGLGPRRQLRAVCHRFKALVDEQVTTVELDLNIFSEEDNCNFVKKAALLWPGTRSVELEPGDHYSDDYSISPAVVQALASCEWAKLEIIKFGGNFISKFDCAEALASSKGFPALRELHFTSGWYGGLSNRGIEALSRDLHWGKLEVLKIGHQPLGIYGRALLSLSHAMPALRSLSLPQSEMTDENLKDFCEGSWPSLEILDLTDNDLGPESGAIFAEASKTWGKLRELDVFGNTLATDGLENLLQGHWPCLEKLGLGKNSLGVRAGALLADASQRLPSLRKLNIASNGLLDTGICALLEGQWPLLESLNTYNTGAEIGALTALAAASIRCPKIRELYFSYFNELDVNGLDTLAQGSWDSVTKLDISLYPDSQRALNGMVARKVVDIMSSRLPSLKELCLCNCDLGISGLEGVLHGQWRGLEILDLTNNNLQDEGAVLLAEASLNVLSGIKRLDLGSNVYLKDAGINSLMEGNWPNMETLSISNTGMEGSRGAMAIAAAASRLLKLRVLLMVANDIDEAGSMALLKADWGAMKEIAINKPRVSYKSEDKQEKLQVKAAVQPMKDAAHQGGFKLQLCY